MDEQEMIREAMRLIRSIPSEKRAEASRENGKKGGRPKGAKNKPKPTPQELAAALAPPP